MTLKLAGCSIVNARLSWFRITVTAHQTDLVTFVLIVRIPTEGIEDFRAYEDETRCSPVG
jgi:hypothetical protein